MDEASTILQSGTLDSGEISARNAGYETDAGTAWVFYGDKYLYRLNYNQGNAGVTASYILGDDGTVTQRPKTYQIRRFTTYGPLGDNIVTVSAGDTDESDASGNKAQGLLFNYLNVASETNRTASVGCENYLGNGEYVTFAGLVETGGKVYTSVVPMGMSKYGVAYDGGSRVTYPDLVAKESGGSGSGGHQRRAGDQPHEKAPQKRRLQFQVLQGVYRHRRHGDIQDHRLQKIRVLHLEDSRFFKPVPDQQQRQIHQRLRDYIVHLVSLPRFSFGPERPRFSVKLPRQSHGL